MLIFEHLDFHAARTALGLSAEALRRAQPRRNRAKPPPSIRFAVPDINAETPASTIKADFRDWHRARYSALTICQLLESAGLEGRLLEWSYARASPNYNASRVFVRGKGRVQEHTGVTTNTRIHDWGPSVAEQGLIRRSSVG